MIKIVLDAGHYAGYNQSQVYKAYREGNMTWKLYLYLKEELEKYGFMVVGTRTNQSKDVPVYDRGQMAKDADLFISLHSNACNNPIVKRVVVIPPYVDVNNTYKLANMLASTVSKYMGITEKYQIYTRTYVDSYGRTRDYYGVIRGAVDSGCKRSLIIEHGFHTNESIAKWLYVDTNLKKMAIEEAAVIAEYFGIKKKTVVETPKITYSVGDKYVMKANDFYSNGKAVSKFTIGQTYTISKVLPERILLKEINSWVLI